MTFQNSANTNNWQETYTHLHARHDAIKYRLRFILPIISLVSIFLIYAFSYPALFPFLDVYPTPQKEILTFLIVLTSFLLLSIFTSYVFAKGFLIEFYRPPKGINLYKIINFRLFGKSNFISSLNMFPKFEYLIVRDGDAGKEDDWLRWSAINLGGPIGLSVFDGFALYLERGSRFSRVVGQGDNIPFLEWFETIKYVVDLRPKVREDKFDVWTKDGIKIKVKARLECRIGDPKKKDPDGKLVYPYDPSAVQKAIERYALRWPTRPEGEPSEFTWIDAAWGQVTGIVPGYIGSRTLDDLFMADRNGGQILSPNAIQEIISRLNSAANGFGVYVTDFQVLEIALPPEVEEYQREYWRAEKQSRATIIDGETKAYHIRTREKARADAQRDIIFSIVDGLNKNKDGRFIEPLLLSLSGILDESVVDPLVRAYISREALEAFRRIQQTRNND